MDSTLALGAFRVERGAGGEGVDVNGSLVEREKGDEFGIETPASSSTIACGQQKVKGGHGSSSASSSASSIPLNLGVGCAPSCWPIFGFRNLLGARRGAEGSFLCSLITDFLAEGAGWEASPGRGGELGCQAQQVLKKFVRLASAFPSPPTRSLSNRKGRGRRSGT